MSVRMVTVKYYSCDCDWISKYCDDYHTETARIPASVLERWAVSS